MRYSLLLTLGHNSSAILIRDGKILCGYETERISKVKADSAFPELAIDEIRKHYVIPKNIDIYVSHWFTDGKLEACKWWRPGYIVGNFPNATIYSLNRDFTHHDAHAWSALAFAQYEIPQNNTLILVADGFGNFGETMSIYEYVDEEPKIFKRVFGYHTSLGLFYQYATSYLGMKENQDEYKLLGYEAYINELKIDRNLLDKQVGREAEKFLKNIFGINLNKKFDPVIALDALPAVKHDIHSRLNNLNRAFGVKKNRILTAYFVQKVVETVISTVIKTYEPTNVVLVGGLFYNVKLNSLIADLVEGYTCIMPLAGDQGAAIGLYQSIRHDLIWPQHLFWGKRPSKVDLKNPLPHNFQVLYEDEAAVEITAHLEANRIVNVVKGDMEFGPRALGNTSTLALPVAENVAYINKVNGRNTIMPMAPMVIDHKMRSFFKYPEKIIKSLEYMVCTRTYRAMNESYDGVSHKLPTNGGYTGRPQMILPGDMMYDVLGKVKNHIMINTSFNIHGLPIVFDWNDAIKHHNEQIKNDNEDRIRTIYVLKRPDLNDMPTTARRNNGE